MAQAKPERISVADVLKLVDQLSTDEREQLLQEMKVRELRREIQVGIDQLDRGEGIPGEQVFSGIRERLERGNER